MATATELYRFSEQASGLIWTFTSGNEEVVYGGETYVPASLERSEAEVKNEIAKANIDVRLSLDSEIGLRWMADNGEKIVTMTIFERDKVGGVNVVWKGRLSSVIPGMASITLKMESIFTSLRRSGLRARYQRSCRHALYARGCLLDPEAFAVPANATAISGRTLTVTEAGALPDGHFVGGMLRTPDGTLSYVVNHVGTAITLQRLSFALSEEVTGGFPFAVTLYPGCDHSRQTCNDKFANLLNYGGFDFIPSKNPMGGSSIV